MKENENVTDLSLVRRKWLTKRGGCEHKRVYIDACGYLCECRDCGEFVDPAVYLRELASEWESYERRRNALRREIDELKAWNPWLKVCRKIEKIWRRGGYTQCPHCQQPLGHKDFNGHLHFLSPEYVKAYRAKVAKLKK